jgi:hypothetical protein
MTWQHGLTPMLNFFKPHCPVDQSTKEWIETRFAWLTAEFGLERLLTGKTIVPTEEFFPPQYECTEEGLTDLMHRIATFLGIDPRRLDLHFYEEKSPAFDLNLIDGSVGLYAENNGRFEIWLEVNSLGDPGVVIATLAHELCHVLLLGQNRVSHDLEDHEELTDLLVAFMGLGIFAANSTFYETNFRGLGYSAWSVGKRGYLSMHAIGYALSLYALARGQDRPDWLIYLRPDARAYVKRGIRYIKTTQACSFQPAVGRVH